MKTILLTGGIGSGKSAVSTWLSSKGVPVYDCDSALKRLYDTDSGLLSKVEASLAEWSDGRQLLIDGKLDRKALAAVIFGNAEALQALEKVAHPAVLDDFVRWQSSQEAEFVVMESAIAASKPLFREVYDAVVLVDAPLELRVERACRRDGASPDAVRARVLNQSFEEVAADAVIVNDSDMEELFRRAEEAFKRIIKI